MTCDGRWFRCLHSCLGQRLNLVGEVSLSLRVKGPLDSVMLLICMWGGASVACSLVPLGWVGCFRRHNTCLQTLELGDNNIDDAGAAAIGEGLRYDD